MTFQKFANLVQSRLDQMLRRGPSSAGPFVVDVTGDDLYAVYLASFPEGTNPIFKARREHDCSCCKSFIRHVGMVVTYDAQGRMETIWDAAVQAAPVPYNVVAEALRNRVLHAHVSDLFRVAKSEAKFGAQETHQLIDANPNVVQKWNHFYTGDLPQYLRIDNPDQVRGEYRTTVSVFERGLKELKPDAFDTVLDLIAGKALYRGEEFGPLVEKFRAAQLEYRALGLDAQIDFVWRRAVDTGVARFRNTVIGTLVQDLSESPELLEDAVKQFEAKVAPANYKRPTAVITPGMVKQAVKTINELGLEPALERRFARIDDINVNDVKWVDSSVQSKMKGGIEGMLMASVVQPPADVDRTEEVDVDTFMSEVLPKAQAMDLLLKSDHLGNLMSLTAPVHPEPFKLFKWDNDFAWSYNGNIADSEMRRAVQARGGSVTGAFRFTHSWNHPGRENTSLMDLHVAMPGCTAKVGMGARQDNYGVGPRVGWNARGHGPSGGIQDVDYTGAAPKGYIPVENITFPDLGRMPEGRYLCRVSNYCFRPGTIGGFQAEIEFGGRVFQYDYPKVLKNHEWVDVATVTLKDGAFTIEHHIPCGSAPQEKWGLKTEQFVKVKTVTLSPNYWGDNAVGNKHYFLVLEGAKNDEPTRGIYNEFLHPRLEAHRKVFEMIGEKTKCQPTEGQLSGVGFSSTKRDSVVVRVTTGKKQRLYTVKF